MLPEFDERGYLPPGIHSCRVDEILTRFGHGSPEREVETAELAEFVAWARQMAFRHVLLAGSYVTSRLAPNDLDLVVLPGESYPEAGTVSDRMSNWPFLHIMVAADQADLEQWVEVDLGTDRDGVARGVVEIQL